MFRVESLAPPRTGDSGNRPADLTLARLARLLAISICPELKAVGRQDCLVDGGFEQRLTS